MKNLRTRPPRRRRSQGSAAQRFVEARSPACSGDTNAPVASAPQNARLSRTGLAFSHQGVELRQGLRNPFVTNHPALLASVHAVRVGKVSNQCLLQGSIAVGFEALRPVRHAKLRLLFLWKDKNSRTV